MARALDESLSDRETQSVVAVYCIFSKACVYHEFLVGQDTAGVIENTVLSNRYFHVPFLCKNSTISAVGLCLKFCTWLSFELNFPFLLISCMEEIHQAES